MTLLGNTSNRAKSFKDSLKALEADIQYANTMALGIPRGNEGACLQFRLGYGPASHFLLCLFRWADCSIVGAFGLLHILIYKVLKDGTTTMSTYERRASLREFYSYILPSLQVLDGGITETELHEQRANCMERYKSRFNQEGNLTSVADLERENECGICLETVSKIVLPDCSHSVCMKCYKAWQTRSQSCPFCRISLKRVSSVDLWVLADHSDVEDIVTLTKANLDRLFTFVDKLPLVISRNQCDMSRGCAP